MKGVFFLSIEFSGISDLDSMPDAKETYEMCLDSAIAEINAYLYLEETRTTLDCIYALHKKIIFGREKPVCRLQVDEKRTQEEFNFLLMCLRSKFPDLDIQQFILPVLPPSSHSLSSVMDQVGPKVPDEHPTSRTEDAALPPRKPAARTAADYPVGSVLLDALLATGLFEEGLPPVIRGDVEPSPSYLVLTMTAEGGILARCDFSAFFGTMGEKINQPGYLQLGTRFLALSFKESEKTEETVERFDDIKLEQLLEAAEKEGAKFVDMGPGSAAYATCFLRTERRLLGETRMLKNPLLIIEVPKGVNIDEFQLKIITSMSEHPKTKQPFSAWSLEDFKGKAWLEDQVGPQKSLRKFFEAAQSRAAQSREPLSSALAPIARAAQPFVGAHLSMLGGAGGGAGGPAVSAARRDPAFIAPRLGTGNKAKAEAEKKDPIGP